MFRNSQHVPFDFYRLSESISTNTGKSFDGYDAEAPTAEIGT